MNQRMERAQRLMSEQDIDALLVGPSADLRYLLGYQALPLERLTLLILPARSDAHLVVPELERPRAAASGAGEWVEIHPWSEQDDPFDLVDRLLTRCGLEPAASFAVQDRLWSQFLLRLQQLRPAASWRAGSAVMRPLRVVKTRDEVDALRAAGAAIDAVHERVPDLLRPGRSEVEVGRDIADLIRRNHDEVNFVIVASGPNGASPHHETGMRRLEEGDAVVVDIGGTLDGYCSDMTRNYVMGAAPDRYTDLHDLLLEAQVAAVEAVAPGIPAEDVDRTARDVIDGGGYGEQFVHRTGHGIGVEEHEHPYIVGGNPEPLAAGMTFSVEPGIYVPGRYGARIEDIVAVTHNGVERLNTLSREFVEVPVRS